MQTAVIAGGCFWGVQGVYQHIRGVQKALSGYIVTHDLPKVENLRKVFPARYRERPVTIERSN